MRGIARETGTPDVNLRIDNVHLGFSLSSIGWFASHEGTLLGERLLDFRDI